MRVCVCVWERGREGEREREERERERERERESTLSSYCQGGEGGAYMEMGAYMYLGQVHAKDYCTSEVHEPPKERPTSIDMWYDFTSYGHTVQFTGKVTNSRV